MRLPLLFTGITQGLHQYNAYDFGWHQKTEKYMNEYAVADAYVYNVYTSITGGNILTLRIEAGENFIWATYKHCAKIFVKKGQEVKMGDLVAYMGATGNAKGEHLHLELAKAPKHIVFENTLAFEKKYATPFFAELFAYEGQIVSKSAITQACNIKCVAGCHFEDYVNPDSKTNMFIAVKNTKTEADELREKITNLNVNIKALEAERSLLSDKLNKANEVIANAKKALERV